MTQAIETKYHGPTNTCASYVMAKSQAGKLRHAWDHALDIAENHREAAKALAAKHGWQGTWYAGGSPNGSGYVFVCARRERDGGCVTADTFDVSESDVNEASK